MRQTEMTTETKVDILETLQKLAAGVIGELPENWDEANREAEETFGEDNCPICGAGVKIFHHIKKYRIVKEGGGDNRIIPEEYIGGIEICPNCHLKIHGRPNPFYNSFAEDNINERTIQQANPQIKKAIESGYAETQCPNCTSENVVKDGVAHTRQKKGQIWRCNTCRKTFRVWEEAEIKCPKCLSILSDKSYSWSEDKEGLRNYCLRCYKCGDVLSDKGR